MPRGSLTPLTRQLWTVLVNLDHSVPPNPPRCLKGSPRHLSVAVRVRQHVAGMTIAEEESPHTSGRQHEVHNSFRREVGVPKVTRRGRRDFLSEALRDAGSETAAPHPPPANLGFSHCNANIKQNHHLALRNHARDFAYARYNSHHTKGLTLERITAYYIRHCPPAAHTGQVDRPVLFNFRPWEASFLQAKGYGLDDIKAWAHILSAEDSFTAAEALADRCATRGPLSVPIFVPLYLLRRPYVNARALRVLILEVANMLIKTSQARDQALVRTQLILLFVRLVRHAREVWPQVLPNITELLLAYLPSFSQGDKRRRSTDLIHLLNKAMYLISLPTAVEPFKDSIYQEAAIVRILRFMAEHEPALHVSREGYQAVVRVQLRQKMTPKDRQWAGLKALSWPPWKHERTAMDADITASEHGVSRAVETLARMREAGYAPLRWEQTAKLYAGWDTDRTPTIQTRVMFYGGAKRFARSEAALWVARIMTTRTVQEAWAAFLAYEDAKQRPNSGVYFAIFQKLYQEERRLRRDPTPKAHNSDGRQPHSHILPGDVREIQPLPPSTHLHTYTRSQPPTVHEFYRKLREQSVILSEHCLAFLVANAASLRIGFEYIRDARSSWPALHKLLTWEPSSDSLDIPETILSAFIELLCRHPNTRIPYAAMKNIDIHAQYVGPILKPKDHRLDIQHPLVHATELLRVRRTKQRSPWNSILSALSRDYTRRGMRFLFIPNKRALDPKDEGERIDLEGAYTSYRFLRRVLAIMRDFHVDLDVEGFYRLCIAVENVTIACWSALRSEFPQIDEIATGHKESTEQIREANNFLRSMSPVIRLKSQFEDLVGNDGPACAASAKYWSEGISPLPELLAVPSPAVLHVYIRALGWFADHDGLLALVHWMNRHRSNLAKERERHYNGERMMRRALVALRVFLERSWLGLDPNAAYESLSCGNVKETERPDRCVQSLWRLESPASASVAREARDLIEGVQDWNGWPRDEEVEVYCQDSRFQQIAALGSEATVVVP